MLPAIIAGGAALLGAGITTAFGVREARKNREFQERMSSTAHQREVEDLRRAGLNPALSATGGSGASTPSGAMADYSAMGDAIPRSVATALQVRQAEASIEQTRSAALLSRTQANDLATSATYRYAILAAEQAIKENDAQKVQQLLPILVDQARAELDLTQGSARATKARAALDELARAGALNEAQWQELIGTLGPTGRVLGKAFRAFGGNKLRVLFGK